MHCIKDLPTFDKFGDNILVLLKRNFAPSQLTNLRSTSMPTSSRKMAIGVFLLNPSISLALATLNEDRAKFNRSFESKVTPLKNRAGIFLLDVSSSSSPRRRKF